MSEVYSEPFLLPSPPRYISQYAESMEENSGSRRRCKSRQNHSPTESFSNEPHTRIDFPFLFKLNISVVSEKFANFSKLHSVKEKGEICCQVRAREGISFKHPKHGDLSGWDLPWQY